MCFHLEVPLVAFLGRTDFGIAFLHPILRRAARQPCFIDHGPLLRIRSRSVGSAWVVASMVCARYAGNSVVCTINLCESRGTPVRPSVSGSWKTPICNLMGEPERPPVGRCRRR
jgi:hypothetical protein